MCKFKGETNHHQMKRHWLKSYRKYDKPTSTLGGILQHPVHILDGAGASLRWARAALQLRWQPSLQSLESFRTSQPWLCVNSHFKAIIFPKKHSAFRMLPPNDFLPSLENALLPPNVFLPPSKWLFASLRIDFRPSSRMLFLRINFCPCLCWRQFLQ